VEYGMATDTIAYLRINDFSQEAAQAVGQVLSLPEIQAASGLVLDIRDNPGGLVMSARAVASQFLREGVVAVEETRAGIIELPVIPGGLAPEGMAIVAIVNAGTASAAEIVAAALQGHDRAQIVGERTFGKNLVQEVFDAPGGGEYRITAARWTGPGGIDVGTGGLSPDVTLDETASGSDPALDLAISLLGG
jgi:carboxyl-terminal processing protease